MLPIAFSTFTTLTPTRQLAITLANNTTMVPVNPPDKTPKSVPTDKPTNNQGLALEDLTPTQNEMSKCTIKSLKSIKMFASLLWPFVKIRIKACLTHEIKNVLNHLAEQIYFPHNF